MKENIKTGRAKRLLVGGFDTIKTYAYSNGVLLKEFNSRRDAAKFYGITDKRVCMCIKNKGVCLLSVNGIKTRIAFRNILTSKP